MITHSISLSEIVERIQTPEGTLEITAACDADYNAPAHELCVQLSCFACPEDLTDDRRHRTLDWLPAPESVREHVEREEAREQAREIFASWVRRVRQAVDAWKVSSAT